MLSTSGAKLLPEASIKRLRDELLPITTILTPNVPEAVLLLKDAGVEFDGPHNREDLIKLATEVHRLGPQYVLLKGGHAPLGEVGKVAINTSDSKIVVDTLFGEGEVHQFTSDYQESRNTHGTGCSLACKV